MKQEDTLKYFEENLKRVARLEQVIQNISLDQVSLRDKVIHRNSFLNEAIRVANEELGYNLAEVRYRKKDVNQELMVLIQILKNESEKEAQKNVV